jgi:hypothetical protein
MEQTTISILNVLGEVVIVESINGTSVIDVSGLDAGIYLIQSNRGIKTKFIKQ